MKKIICIGYREWALSIYKKLSMLDDYNVVIFKSKSEIDEKKIIKYNPDYILYYGWSWKISDYLVENFKTLMLHPSDLPKFRGGSPIQNQIIRGIKNSKVTIFQMTDKLDAGPILAQRELSLDGSIKQIFKRIERIGLKLTLEIFKSSIKPIIQDDNNASYYKRRKPEESEITLEELKNKKSDYLYNKIRMLQDPYPNAFIKTSDNKRLILKVVEMDDDL